ncbi:MAG: c-type cytochrome [bacterium]|nr:c-type cytochrome [bacterium]
MSRIPGTAAVALIALFVTATVAAEPDGSAVFQRHCATCHGASGRTDTPHARALKVRPLADDPTLAGMDVVAIVEAIRSNPKHQGIGALTDLDAARLTAAAEYVRTLARGR